MTRTLHYRGYVSLKVLHLSTYTNGGAGRAAQALHQAMLAEGLESTLRSGSGLRCQIAGELDRRFWRLQRSPIVTWRSPARFGSVSAHEINNSDADIVNLHWVTDGLLTVEEIGRIRKPLVWTMHDMWPFTGTEHYTLETRIDGSPARWRTGYTRGNRPSDESGLDLDRWTWERKRRDWVRPPHLIPVSKWLGDLAHSSALAHSWPISVIPNVMNATEFTPGDKHVARVSLNLPLDIPLILFTSSAGISDDRKGWHLLQRALPLVLAQHTDAEVVVVGPRGAQDTPDVGALIHWLGHLEGDARIAQAICASDVAVVPSTTDNLPMTACEAQSCGRPVVAFAVGGLPDIVEHQATGYLAEPFDTGDLATGICQAIEDERHERCWGTRAAERAQRTWSPSVVVASYLNLYESILGRTP